MTEPVAEYAKGGMLPPRENDDDLIPAIRDCGYLLSASEVRKLGSGMLRRLNEGLTSGFKDGANARLESPE